MNIVINSQWGISSLYGIEAYASFSVASVGVGKNVNLSLCAIFISRACQLRFRITYPGDMLGHFKQRNRNIAKLVHNSVYSFLL